MEVDFIEKTWPNLTIVRHDCEVDFARQMLVSVNPLKVPFLRSGAENFHTFIKLGYGN
jgi:hypothetical protein